MCARGCLRMKVKKVPRRRRRICSAARQHLRIFVIEGFPNGKIKSPSPRGIDRDSSLHYATADKCDGPGPKSSMLAQLQFGGGQRAPYHHRPARRTPKAKKRHSLTHSLSLTPQTTDFSRRVLDMGLPDRGGWQFALWELYIHSRQERDQEGKEK
ncbi:hypothetical protein LY78DRAFT_126583 [Colletotrichum sublineola]|nr:hypothetical protein LY78DRAFT_126583 [Colletotrichum sublineola]